MGMRAEVAVAESLEQQYQRAYERFAGDIFRFALAWTNDWSSAEDLTQEAYLRLWLHRDSVDWDRPIVPWLLVTARHLATDRFRALRRRFLAPRAGHVADESVQVRWLDVRQAMGRLTSLERTALIMTAVEGWSYADLADLLQTTDSALRAAVSRARDKLEVV
jgi:RNA polymerase sigma-70 factor (ECF subfamily)